MADNPFLDNDSFASNDTANTTYDRVREGYDQGFEFSTNAADKFAKDYSGDRARYRTAVGANGLGAQQVYRDQWAETSPTLKHSTNALMRANAASGAASGSQFSGGQAIKDSVSMADLENRLFREHQGDLGGVYGVSQKAEAGRVANINNYLTSLYPSLASWLGNTQLGIDNANTNFTNQQALQNQQLAQADNNSNNNFWGSILSGGLGVLSSLFCSRDIKTDIEEVDDVGAHKSPFLDAINKLPIFFWRYNDVAAERLNDSDMHISPMSQDWAKAFGGDEHKISQADVLGITLMAFKELSAKVEALEVDNAQMQQVIMSLTEEAGLTSLDVMEVDPEDLGYVTAIENHK